MLTPLDIESKVFSKSFQGYNANEVKAFLKEILTYYEKFYKENIELKDKLATLQEGIQYYKNLENTLHSTLILAEKTAEETKTLARHRADQIEKEAQLKADVILNDAKNEITEINRVKEELLHSYDVHKVQIKQFLLTQLELTEKSMIDKSLSRPANNYLSMINKEEADAQLEAAATKINDNKEADSNEDIKHISPIKPFTND